MENFNALEETKKEVSELRHIISAYAGQIDRNQQTIYKLLDGLYSVKQNRAFKHLVAILLGWSNEVNTNEVANEVETNEDTNEVANEEDDEDDDMYNTWPTTRQGDDHEERLAALEEKFRERDAKMTMLEEKNRQMEAKIEAMEKRQQEKMGFNM
jgi:septal ring factor EnvC (AmiA/AmiB activator)